MTTKGTYPMRYMNTYDIESAANRYRDHPILGPAVLTLVRLVNWTNRNSDGWAYWPKPCRAAAKLMELIEGGDRFDYERSDVTVVQYNAALRPIKAFKTRHNADFEIATVDPERVPA